MSLGKAYRPVVERSCENRFHSKSLCKFYPILQVSAIQMRFNTSFLYSAVRKASLAILKIQKKNAIENLSQ